MGAGNFTFSGEDVLDYEQVYVHFCGPDEEEDYDGDVGPYWDDVYEMLVDDIHSLLPKSFTSPTPGSWSRGKGQLVFYNGLFEVRIGDNETSLAVGVLVPETDHTGTNALAVSKLPPLANKLFDGLYKMGYELYVRSGPWTSGCYQPTTEN